MKTKTKRSVVTRTVIVCVVLALVTINPVITVTLFVIMVAVWIFVGIPLVSNVRKYSNALEMTEEMKKLKKKITT